MNDKRLKKTVVGIAGLGGLGSNIAVSLARIGVINMILVDFDKVEASNLNRQYFFKNQIGKYKAEALKEIIDEINPNINIKIHKKRIDDGNIMDFFGNIDILVEALDDPKSKAMLVNNFLINSKNTKVVAASGIAGFDSSNSIVTKKINSRFFLIGDESNSKAVREDLYLAPRVCIAANHQANMVLRLILDREDV